MADGPRQIISYTNNYRSSSIDTWRRLHMAHWTGLAQDLRRTFEELLIHSIASTQSNVSDSEAYVVWLQTKEMNALTQLDCVHRIGSD